MKRKPLILITNDDGVAAEGIKALLKHLRGLGRLVVMAPKEQQSGMSNAITSKMPVYYELLHQEEDVTIYHCTGTPTDCVKLAINEVLPEKPDLLVSGINEGGNQAICVHYSGTVGAAIEGCIFSVPSLAVSLYQFREGADFTHSGVLARKLSEQILKEGLPFGTYLNLNVPNVSTVKGVTVCRQTAGRWVKEYDVREDGEGKSAYWLTGEFLSSEPIMEDNDTLMLDQGYASLVPCVIDVTDYALLDTLKQWTLE